MNKVYKYRPLSEFLFKELFYQELYFASYSELNDPLDLSARVEFTSEDRGAIEYLIWFIFKTHFNFDKNLKSNVEASKLLSFNNNEDARNLLIDAISSSVTETLKGQDKIWTHDILEIIEDSIRKTKTDIVFRPEKFKSELNRLTNKFLKNSSITCFSGSNEDFMMWSHYASKHSGICLEFNLENGMFPFEQRHKRKADEKKYKKRISRWDTEASIYWSGLRKVGYQKEQPFINFYHFAVVFENEYDCDLIGLSKSWTHKYARELEWIFSTKTDSWSYENEWRAIEINFDNPKEPEERIRHYPIESLSSIYFGINTPESSKIRIYKIVSDKKSEVQFFESNINGTNKIEFSIWEYFEE